MLIGMAMSESEMMDAIRATPGTTDEFNSCEVARNAYMRGRVMISATEY